MNLNHSCKVKLCMNASYIHSAGNTVYNAITSFAVTITHICMSASLSLFPDDGSCMLLKR